MFTYRKIKCLWVNNVGRIQLKESEFLFNYRNQDLYKILLKMFRNNPQSMVAGVMNLPLDVNRGSNAKGMQIHRLIARQTGIRILILMLNHIVEVEDHFSRLQNSRDGPGCKTVVTSKGCGTTACRKNSASMV